MTSCLLLTVGLFFVSAHFALSLVVRHRNTLHSLWPLPAEYTTANTNITINDPCHFSFNITSNDNIPQIADLINLYRNYMFSSVCNTTTSTPTTDTDDPNSILHVIINDATQFLMLTNTSEAYNLTVEDGYYALYAETYIGFVRGLETFSQLLTYTKNSDNSTTVSIPFTPVTIIDKPRFSYRGIMLDTARHFISKEKILQIMDGMLSAKLNVFHWHITDSDSFPMYMPSIPDLSFYGAYSQEETYSEQDVKDIVSYAILRGIKIIPEVDTPAHSASWALAPEFSSLFFCWKPYAGFPVPKGQINPTLDASYTLLQNIIQDLEAYFPWDSIHLGSDEVFGPCWNDTQVNSFMQEHNISDYHALFNYYVSRARTLVDSNRARQYWTNPDTKFLKFTNDDVLQWWGYSTDLKAGMENYPNNKFVLSNYDVLYLDIITPVSTWLNIYDFEPTNFITSEQLANVIGMEAPMWSELSNDAVVLSGIFPRAISMAERGWSPPQSNSYPKYFAKLRLDNWINRIQRRGISVAPIFSRYCEKYPALCL